MTKIDIRRHAARVPKDLMSKKPRTHRRRIRMSTFGARTSGTGRVVIAVELADYLLVIHAMPVALRRNR